MWSRLSKRARDRRGFSLVELLVVIAIIGILAAIIVPNAFKAVEKGKVAATVADLKAFKTAALNYYADTGVWPEDKGRGVDPGFMTDPGVDGWNGPYLERWPEKTPFGGEYDWENWPDRIAVTIRDASALTEDLMKKIDSDMDDGELTTGNVRKDDGGLQMIILWK